MDSLEREKVLLLISSLFVGTKELQFKYNFSLKNIDRWCQTVQQIEQPYFQVCGRVSGKHTTLAVL